MPLESPAPPSSPVVALAGRRIDAVGTDRERFPLRNRAAVRGLLETELKRRRAELVISSAACGVDLLGLEAAEALGVRRIVILPFDRDRFREASVTDRPGDWGAVFDRMVQVAAAARDLIQLDLPETGEAYREATRKIVAVARAEAGARGPRPFLALLAWEGVNRGEDDYTAEFGRLARDAGGELQTIPTLDLPPHDPGGRARASGPTP